MCTVKPIVKAPERHKTVEVFDHQHTRSFRRMPSTRLAGNALSVLPFALGYAPAPPPPSAGPSGALDWIPRETRAQLSEPVTPR